eukprot:922347_1
MAHKLVSFLNVASKKTCELVPKSALTNDLCAAQLCYLGEKHNSKKILSYQLQALQTLTQWNQYQNHASKIAIVFEMFNMHQQPLLDKYHSNDNNFTLNDLQIEYDKTGVEGFDIENHYGEILQFAKNNSDLFQVFGGFPPRTMAKLFLKTDINDDALWKQIFDLLDLNDDTQKEEHKKDDTQNELMALVKDMMTKGSEKHYQYFYYLLSDQVVPFDQMVRNKENGLFDSYGKIFVAQCFKDTVMAYNIMKLWMTKKYDKIVIIAGHGHLDCGFGVKERIEQCLAFQNVDTSQLKQVMISAQIEEEIKDSPFADNVSDYILFVDNADIE